MLIASSFDALSYKGRALLTIGTFDGVHRGHRFLLEQAKQRAAEHGYGLIIVTFDPCPVVVLRPSIGRYQLLSASQKLAKLQQLQPDVLAIFEFTPALSTLTAHQFMDQLESRLEIAEIWMGEDFRFGRDRAGDMQMLLERGRVARFSLHVVTRGVDDKASISSSRVRDALRNGDTDTATALLGYPFARELPEQEVHEHLWLDGARTSHACTIPSHLALPADGVYATVLQATGRTSASVTAVDSLQGSDQLKVLDLDFQGRPSAVEFIACLGSVNTYVSNKEDWERSALTLVRNWERPSYAAAGNF